ncbi:MAG: redox-regulated ATPase YchF [Methanomicrobiales archaeon]|nr:redox-regulated ATPase YchF [Methanomicrobiales archaeon]MDI6877087.1 redox-regulated ATPase YchF [Methanomicrobiales archaeon]
MITLALAGKPNSGKSTFFKAATLAEVEIADYPFTTIDANHGVAYVRTACPCRELNLACGNCRDGVRFIPVGLVDVAGLVPEAHKGRGLGNQFLDHLREAEAILHIVDASGSTDAEGNPLSPGSHDPRKDIAFLEFEMTMWMYGILDKHWAKLQRMAQAKTFSLSRAIAEVFAGLGITLDHVHAAEEGQSGDLSRASTEERIAFCRRLLAASKPMLVVANKVDQAPEEFIAALTAEGAIAASAASELALRKAAGANLIHYIPGDASFRPLQEAALTPAQRGGLAKIAEVMRRWQGTGVQRALDTAVFELLARIVVYPVEDEHRFSDSQGRVLPDAFLMRRGSTPRDLAFQVHSDIGEGFLYAIDARSRMRIKENHILKHGDIIKIVSTR